MSNIFEVAVNACPMLIYNALLAKATKSMRFGEILDLPNGRVTIWYPSAKVKLLSLTTVATLLLTRHNKSSRRLPSFDCNAPSIVFYFQ